MSATFGLFLLLVVLSGFAANSIIRATEAAVHSPTSLFEGECPCVTWLLFMSEGG